MKTTHTCPKCQHRKLWVVSPIDLPRRITVQLDPAAVVRLKLGGMRGVTTEDPVHGFEAYVCARCGFTECYATTFEHVERVGKLVDGDTGVYR